MERKTRLSRSEINDDQEKRNYRVERLVTAFAIIICPWDVRSIYSFFTRFDEGEDREGYVRILYATLYKSELLLRCK